MTLPVPGAHNARNAAAALAACARWPAPTRRGRGARWRTSAAPGGASSGSGAAAERRAGLRRLRPPPDRGRARRSRRRARSAPRRLVAVFQPHLYSRTRAAAHASSARRWRPPTWSCVLDVYPARERAEDFPGVSGLLVAEAAADPAGGPRGLLAADASTPPSRALRAALRDGDLCLVLGAGDVDALGRAAGRAEGQASPSEHAGSALAERRRRARAPNSRGGDSRARASSSVACRRRGW